MATLRVLFRRLWPTLTSADRAKQQRVDDVAARVEKIIRRADWDIERQGGRRHDAHC